jgi:crossover junction endodeoxyribonuclease RuvC
MRILGIDPGSVATGYGVIERVEGELRHVAHGTLRPPRGATLAARLSVLHDAIAAVVRDHDPDRAVVEQVFVAANPRTALVLGQARGAALVALGSAGLIVSELSAREVKQAVVGSGAATKFQVKSMVRRLLSLEVDPASDAADALAVAICSAHEGALAGLPRRSRRRRRVSRATVAVRRAP